MQQQSVDVAIVGAGAAGVGFGVVLRDLGLDRFAILERDEVGASFEQWPEQMRFITPSFTGEAFGHLDLNSIALETSPAYTLQHEHPSGPEYAQYLRNVASYFDLLIARGVEVTEIIPLPEIDRFMLQTNQGMIESQFVVWAAGEFQYPHRPEFPGAEFGVHSADVSQWQDMEVSPMDGDPVMIIGGYESGSDTALMLAKQGVPVHVLDRNEPWNDQHPDPSVTLSPYTKQRLRRAQPNPSLTLEGDVTVDGIEKNGSSYVVRSADGRHWNTAVPPILATGFRGSERSIQDCFEWQDERYPLLTEHDESTCTPGLFLIGPGVCHGEVPFCFIYKFRQRFPVVAETIARRLDIDTSPIDMYREAGFYLDDLTCCEQACVC